MIGNNQRGSMTNFIDKHIPYHNGGPGSLLRDPGEVIFPIHMIVPYELLSDKHYHVYVKYGYAKAFISNSPELSKWQALYEKMQQDKGRTPDINKFNSLIASMRDKGFLKEYAIPVDSNYDILDGSHRLAISLALENPIYVKMFSKYSKNYGRERLHSCTEEEFKLIDKERENLLRKKQDFSESSLMTIWGGSLPVWNELFQMLDPKKIRRSFIRPFSHEEYLAYIAALYAGDGISNTSLTRKSWALEKFGSKAGVLLLNLNPEELQNLKIQIREKFINKVPFYHFDSIVHTVDNLVATPLLLSLIEPYKPSGNAPLKRDILPGITQFLLKNPHTTSEYREVLKFPDGYKKIPDLVNKRIELTIFDLDGVIADSELISAQAYRMKLAHKGIHISLDEACKMFCGISKKDASDLLKEKYGVQFSLEDEKEKQDWIRKKKLGMKQVHGIQNLIEMTNCHKCIASGSSQEGIERSLKILGLENVFSRNDLFSSKDVPNGKPEPDLFLKIAKHFNVEPDKVMVIEDSVPGIVAANRAGMHYIWCGSGSHIPYTYTRENLVPLTQREYFREIENSPTISTNFMHLFRHKGLGK